MFSIKGNFFRISHQTLMLHKSKMSSRLFSTNIKRNITPNIEEKMNINKKLYKIHNHPLNILRNKIIDFFTKDEYASNRSKLSESHFTYKEDFNPIVSTKQNFFDLLVEKENDTTSPKNTYYWDEDNVLRTHMTAHDVDMIKSGHRAFITIGDVYRRDSIDSTHYPIFHQVDGVRIYEKDKLNSERDVIGVVSEDLKFILQNLNKHIVGETTFRWVDTYFPFTEPSYELEIFFNNDWLEVLGCGILRNKILENAGLDPDKYIAWAFGIGLERLAMKLFEIKDIRYFWSKDERFLNQFSDGKIKKFKAYSKYPPCYKDITFFLNENNFNENDFFELIRTITGDIVEDVKCVDTFVHPKNNRTSKCFRILYRHMDKTVTNDEINIYQFKIRENIEKFLNVELR